MEVRIPIMIQDSMASKMEGSNPLRGSIRTWRSSTWMAP